MFLVFKIIICLYRLAKSGLLCHLKDSVLVNRYEYMGFKFQEQSAHLIKEKNINSSGC